MQRGERTFLFIQDKCRQQNLKMTTSEAVAGVPGPEAVAGGPGPETVAEGSGLEAGGEYFRKALYTLIAYSVAVPPPTTCDDTHTAQLTLNSPSTHNLR